MLPLIPLALTLAPMLARWLGGNDAAAVAGQVAEVARAVVGTDDPAEVAARLEADPAKRADMQVELARIAAEREGREHAARVEELRIAAQDRADARGMARGGGPLAWGAALMSIAVTALFGFACVSVFAGWVTIGEAGGSALLLGALIAAFADVRGFWTGSSASSAAKSGLMGGGVAGPFDRARG